MTDQEALKRARADREQLIGIKRMVDNLDPQSQFGCQQRFLLRLLDEAEDRLTAAEAKARAAAIEECAHRAEIAWQYRTDIPRKPENRMIADAIRALATPAVHGDGACKVCGHPKASAGSPSSCSYPHGMVPVKAVDPEHPEGFWTWEAPSPQTTDQGDGQTTDQGDGLMTRAVNEGDRYQHYKGGVYRMVRVGSMEENLRPVVIYEAEKDGIVWVRSYDEFFGDVQVEGKRIKRFKLIAQPPPQGQTKEPECASDPNSSCHQKS